MTLFWWQKQEIFQKNAKGIENWNEDKSSQNGNHEIQKPTSETCGKIDEHLKKLIK